MAQTINLKDFKPCITPEKIEAGTIDLSKIEAGTIDLSNRDSDLIKAVDLIYKAKKQYENKIESDKNWIKTVEQNADLSEKSAQECRVKMESMQVELWEAKVKAETATTFGMLGVLFGIVCLGILWIN